MKHRLRSYMDELLADVPKTRSVLELKEELISNMEERYQDLITEGYQEEDACQCVIEAMGDVKSLFKHLDEPKAVEEQQAVTEEIRKKRAWIATVAVALYLFGFAFAVICTVFDDLLKWRGDEIGIVGMMIMCIIPTCMLVFRSQMYPAYKRKADTVVEEFKEWQSESKLEKQKRWSVYVIIWLAAVAIYVPMSFITLAFHITWIIFLIAGCIHAAYVLYDSSRRMK